MSKQRIWLFGTVLAGLGIIALGWFIGISPKFAAATAAQLQQQGVEAQNSTAQAQLAAMEEKFDRIDDLRSALSELQEEVTPVVDYADFVDRAGSLATGADVSLIGVTAGLPLSTVSATAVPADATAETSEPEGATTDSEQVTAGDQSTAAEVEPAASIDGSAGLYGVPITISLAGDDADVLEFVDALQAERQLFLVTSLILGVDNDNKRTVTGYIFIQPSADASAPATVSPDATVTTGEVN